MIYIFKKIYYRKFECKYIFPLDSIFKRPSRRTMLDSQEAFTTLFKVTKYGGIWQDKSSTSAYRFYGVIWHFFASFLFTFLGFLYLFHFEDIQALSDCLSVTLTMFAYCIKIVNFIRNREKYLLLIRSLNEVIIKSEYDGNRNHQRIVNHIVRVKKIYVAFASAAIITIAFSGMIPIFNWKEHRLCYALYYPWIDYKHSDVLFIILEIYEMSTMVTAVVDITLDTLPVVYMIFAVGLLEELSDRLENIDCSNEDNKEENSQALKELLNCIKIHKEVKKYIADTEKCFATIIMTQGVMSSLILCTTLFSLSLVSFPIGNDILKTLK